LVSQLLPAAGEAESVTLDDRESLRSARVDPRGFIEGRRRPFVIDEIQRGGDSLVLAIKAAVDRDQRPGSFVLTGSSRFLTVPQLTESLTGRARIIDLWPFSQGELRGGSDRFLARLFGGDNPRSDMSWSPVARASIADSIVRGGFPSAASMASDRSRRQWLVDYARTLVTRDLVELSRVQRAAELPGLLAVLAGLTAQELNTTALSSAFAIPEQTTRAYLSLLETLYVCHRLPAWSGSALARARKRPKLHFVDSGLSAALRGLTAEQLAHPDGGTLLGPLLETFVVAELAKQATWSEVPVRLMHYRDDARREIDVIIESGDGRTIAIEVKGALDVTDRDAQHMAYIRDRIGDRFVHGLVLHPGDRVTSLGDRLTAAPVSMVWE
jgi:predicted AAA+ superfamily ATPase